MSILDVGLPISAVIISAWFLIQTVDNPASIPLRDILPRAAFGLVAFVAAWSIIAIGSEFVIPAFSSRPDLFRLLVASAIGLTLPHVKLEDHIRASWYHYRPLRPLLRVMVEYTELTRTYLKKIINREERKLADVVHDWAADGEAALNELFDSHVPEMTERLSKDPAVGPRARYIGRIRSTATRFKLLLYQLGSDRCMQLLRTIYERIRTKGKDQA